jgi:inner membrane protein
MILAHLPAGYLTARAVGVRRDPVVAAALIGSVAPDLDLSWFYLVDHRQVLHHLYWTHAPGFWAVIALVVLVWIRSARPALFTLTAVFFASVFIHLVLDTPVGGIMWFCPFDHQLFRLFEVQQSERHWIITFMMHPSFLAEIAITGLAAFFLLQARGHRS